MSWRQWILLVGPVLFGVVGLLAWPDADGRTMAWMAGLALWMGLWWITEVIPLGATALLPVAVMPVLGLLSPGQVTSHYANTTIFLFLGGFLIALAMERWDLHRRIALKVLLGVGGGASRLVFGFMLACAALSAWISNTATAVAMLPVGLAVIKDLEERLGKPDTHAFSKCLMLGIAYSASIGGVATLVGTPPNLVLRNLYEQSVPGAVPIGFAEWMLFAVPLSLILLVAAWWVLTRWCFPLPKQLEINADIIRNQYRKLGSWSREEKVVATVFALTGFLWVFRADWVIGSLVLPGWQRLIPGEGQVDDGVIAVFMALLLFCIPARDRNQSQHKRILDGDVFARVPWSIILLFGGGFALAQGVMDSGLSGWIAENVFSGVATWHPLAVVLLVCLLMTFMTELTSNTASTQMILPVLVALAFAYDLPPLLVMIPATVSASMAFMMPVATPPNAIVFGSEKLEVKDMVRAGLILNLIAVVLTTLIVYFVAGPVFGF